MSLLSRFIWVEKIKTTSEALSLHVVIGALCGAIFASEVLDQLMPWWWYFALAGAVWVVYSLDHIADTFLLQNESVNIRHLFHQRNKRAVILAISLVSLLVFLLVLRYDNSSFLIAGFMLALLSLLHILLVTSKKTKNSLFVQKEVMVALIYTLGIWFGPLLLSKEWLDLSIILLIISFAVTVWWESIFVALLEIEHDKKQAIRSLATLLGEKASSKLLVVVLALHLLFILVYAGFAATDTAAWLIILSMNLALMLCYICRKIIYRNGYYHLIGELVFCLPALILLF
ncbi:MAG: UbiA family prenyltransferase [Bacteroidetes bacterium]|nr:UbiA family prenyltransferase [Bacteroidota bacterium]MBU1580588.1 UbiA family prenyltransferase [Bacteroidota bacterium]MBU2557391.1 UbiA family prenyltransferase [Bacteroidota bacterium]